MKSTKIIGVLRPSLIGDIVISTNFLPYLDKILPNSYKCAYIDKKCEAILPFISNDPRIDEIRVSEEKDKVSYDDNEFFSTFNLKLHPFAPNTEEHWYNSMSVQEQIFRMNYFCEIGRVNPNEWQRLTVEEKKPKLHEWFNIVRDEKTIAFWPFAGYTLTDETSRRRSFTVEKANEISSFLQQNGYKVAQFGHPNSPKINSNYNYCHLSLFDSIKLSLGCDVSITTDSGAGHLISSYGYPHICVHAIWKDNHIMNGEAFAPQNYKNNLINMLIRGNMSVSNVNNELLLENIKKLS